MLIFHNEKLYIPLEMGSSSFLEEGYCKVKFTYEKEAIGYEMLFYLTQEAMICLGVNLIFFAFSEVYGLDMRTDPIGDFEGITMGIRLAPGSGSLFFYQNKSTQKLEDFITEDIAPRLNHANQFVIDFNDDSEEYEGRNFQSTALIEIYDMQKNRSYNDTIFYLNKAGLFRFGIGLIQLAQNFQVGDCYTLIRDGENRREGVNYFQGVTVTKDSPNIKICCAELPSWGEYRNILETAWSEIGNKDRIIKQLYLVLAKRVSREHIARWASACLLEDSKGRCSIFEKEIREISNLDYKLENGRYQYRRKDILKIIERLQRKR